jgi:hypothetical protein
MGIPGKMWKEELTRKKVPSWKMTDGSGENPEIMGFEYFEVMFAFKVTRTESKKDLTDSIEHSLRK